MTDTTDAPNPAAAAPAADPNAAPAAAAAAAPAPANDPNAPPAPAADKGQPPAWVQPRIDQLTREKHEANRRAEALEAELAKARGAQPANPAVPAAPANPAAPAAPGAMTVTPEEHDRRVKAEAAALRRMEEFNARCEQTFQNGTKEIPTFQQDLQRFNALGGLGSPQGIQLVVAAQATDAPHKVLHALSGDLNEAMRVMSLPPIEQAIALERMATKLKQTPVSAAPPPVNPITGGGGSGEPKPDENGDFKSQDDYRAWRNKNFKRARG